MTGTMIDSAELRRRITRHLSHHNASYYAARELEDQPAMDRCAARSHAVMEVLAEVRAMEKKQ